MNPLYEMQEAGDGVFWRRAMFEVINDHPVKEDRCPGCVSALLSSSYRPGDERPQRRYKHYRNACVEGQPRRENVLVLFPDEKPLFL